MGGFRTSRLVIAGAVLALIGVLALAVPVFTTEQTKDIAKVGDLKLTTREESAHAIPPFIGPAALALGIVLIGAGFAARRRAAPVR